LLVLEKLEGLIRKQNFFIWEGSCSSPGEHWP
jgi:hypothetical protein